MKTHAGLDPKRWRRRNRALRKGPDSEPSDSKLFTPSADGRREQTAAPLTPRQRQLGDLLAALLVADYRAFPPASVESRAGPDRGCGHSQDPVMTTSSKAFSS